MPISAVRATPPPIARRASSAARVAIATWGSTAVAVSTALLGGETLQESEPFRGLQLVPRSSCKPRSPPVLLNARLCLATEEHVELTAWRRLQRTARAGAQRDFGGQRDTRGDGVVEVPSRPRPTGASVVHLTDENRGARRTDRRPHVDGAKVDRAAVRRGNVVITGDGRPLDGGESGRQRGGSAHRDDVGGPGAAGHGDRIQVRNDFGADAEYVGLDRWRACETRGSRHGRVVDGAVAAIGYAVGHENDGDSALRVRHLPHCRERQRTL